MKLYFIEKSNGLSSSYFLALWERLPAAMRFIERLLSRLEAAPTIHKFSKLLILELENLSTKMPEIITGKKVLTGYII